MQDRVSTKHSIPHPTEPRCTIVGVLEQLSEAKPCSGRKIALILHGAAGHKDYLFQKRLAHRIPMDSFRFDFRGNHETGTPEMWRQGNLVEDLEDLSAVVDFLKSNYGYVIDLIVGHSRGSVVGMHWACTAKEGSRISGFVNASGRYRMEKILDEPEIKRWVHDIATQGHAVYTPTVARKKVTFTIHAEDLEKFIQWDTSVVWDNFPAAADVFTIHGLSDQTVTPYDAVIYARAFGGRNPGTHNLHFVENGDHNFTGRQDEVVDAILEWWDKHLHRNLKSGIWRSDIKGKL